jgi:hypothetical protein
MNYGDRWPVGTQTGGPAITPATPGRPARSRHARVLAYETARLDAADPPGSWYCPGCGLRLSYGVYCKTCRAEQGIQWRPATGRDRLTAALLATPAPEFPRFADDSA